MISRSLGPLFSEMPLFQRVEEKNLEKKQKKKEKKKKQIKRSEEKENNKKKKKQKRVIKMKKKRKRTSWITQFVLLWAPKAKQTALFVGARWFIQF